MSRAMLALSPFVLLILGGCAESPTMPDSSAAPAAPNLATSANATNVSRFPISFELTPEQCPILTTTVTGEGVFVFIAHESARGPQDMATFRFQSSATGTASGSDGSTYRFAYSNHYRDDGSVTLPYVFTVTDQFVLAGQGGAPHIQTQFLVTVRANADGTYTALDVKVHGDPGSCDPI